MLHSYHTLSWIMLQVSSLQVYIHTCLPTATPMKKRHPDLQFEKNTTSAEQDSNLRPIAYNTAKLGEVVSIQIANGINCDENNNTGVLTSTCRSAHTTNYPENNVFQNVKRVTIKLCCIPHF